MIEDNIQKILDYLIDGHKEKDHYDLCDEFEKKQHIYKEVKIVQKWLNDKDKVI